MSFLSLYFLSQNLGSVSRDGMNRNAQSRVSEIIKVSVIWKTMSSFQHFFNLSLFLRVSGTAIVTCYKFILCEFDKTKFCVASVWDPVGNNKLGKCAEI